MRVPEVFSSLIDEGIIDEVVRPLQSGKEAQIYLVWVDGQLQVAKVYKDVLNRSFKQRAQYTEGRRVRNSRDQRAMDKHTRHGKAQEEEAWKSAEVDVIYRLQAQGVRVPIPYNFIDGVLLMELVLSEDGQPAPRLGELALDTQTAREYYAQLLRETVKMLCAGIVHGDLSDYNVLVDANGPVIIDFPQSVDAAHNRNAKQLLLRDVDNLTAFLMRFDRSAQPRPYGAEIWDAYEHNRLTPDMELTGKFGRSAPVANVGALLDEIEDVAEEERQRRERKGQASPRPRRRQVRDAPKPDPRRRTSDAVDDRGGRPRTAAGEGAPRGRRRRGRLAKTDAADQGNSTPAAAAEGAPKGRRRRRRGRSAQGRGSALAPHSTDATDAQPGSSSDTPQSRETRSKQAASDTAPPRSRRPRRRRRR